MTTKIVIAMYRPHEGRDEELRKMVASHVPTLRRLGFVTDRPEILCRSEDGTFLEIFEWTSTDASRRAHEHPEVVAIWEPMGEIATFPSLGSLPEAEGRFPHFEPVH